MANSNKTGIWLAQTRANFLFLAIMLFLIGLALALEHPGGQGNGVSLVNSVLLAFGVVLAHTSVNLFNEYSDYRTRIDFNTIRNPFSGGSGMIVGGKTSPGQVLAAAIVTLIVSLSIGVYFVLTVHWFLIILIALGALAVILYTDFLAKILLGEFFAGLTLGTFVVLGVYISLTATPGMALGEILPQSVVWISIPPGILTSLLLLLNEFPDSDADKRGGRYHLVIWLGKKNAAIIYTFGLIAAYGIIVAMPIAGLASWWIYLALLTLPVAVKAASTAITHSTENDKIIPAMGQNVIVVLATDLLIAVGTFI